MDSLLCFPGPFGIGGDPCGREEGRGAGGVLAEERSWVKTLQLLSEKRMKNWEFFLHVAMAQAIRVPNDP